MLLPFVVFHLATLHNLMIGPELYFSIATEATSETLVKGSRFICHASPTNSREEAESYVSIVSKKYHDATHNCFAYKIGFLDEATIRCNDDGEPSGTAGRPILQALEGKELTNISVVVTRYFGGTKLGTGGLVRAYGGVASAALENATIVEHFPQSVLTLRFSYEQTNPVHQMIAKSGAEILASEFGEQTIYRVQMKQLLKQLFIQELINLTSAKIDIEEN